MSLENVFDQENFLDEGLVHRVYKKEGKVFKIPKKRFVEFHDKEHFRIEKDSLALLNEHGIVTHEVYGIESYFDGQIERPVLVEEYVDGESFDNLDRSMLEETAKIIRRLNSIEIKGFGLLKAGLKAEYGSMKSFIRESQETLIDFFRESNLFLEEKLRRIREYFENLFRDYEYGNGARFVSQDMNPGNIIWDKDRTIKAVIDIDHPVSADPLFEKGCLRYYRSPVLNHLEEDYSKDEKIRLTLYQFLKNEMVIHFRYMNGLDIEKQCESLLSRMDGEDSLL